MNQCEWDSDNCKFIGTGKCETCFSYKQNYREKTPARICRISAHQAKENRRAGSFFEIKNHLSNTEILRDKVVSGMTLNSGATVLEKGDEQIRGIIDIMEELKTRTSQSAHGQKNFTIRKEWLDKLHTEALRENKEFWYLKFNFAESDKDVYVITEQDIIMAMVKTMVEDRKTAIKLNKKLAAKQAEGEYLKQKNLALMAQLNYYRQLENLQEDEKDAQLV